MLILSEWLRRKKMSGKDILEEMKQEDYELWIRTQGHSHLSEEQWDWLIDIFEKKMKEESDG